MLATARDPATDETGTKAGAVVVVVVEVSQDNGHHPPYLGAVSLPN